MGSNSEHEYWMNVVLLQNVAPATFLSTWLSLFAGPRAAFSRFAPPVAIAVDNLAK
jgi:hypothetical protein